MQNRHTKVQNRVESVEIHPLLDNQHTGQRQHVNNK